MVAFVVAATFAAVPVMSFKMYCLLSVYVITCSYSLFNIEFTGNSDWLLVE